MRNVDANGPIDSVQQLFTNSAPANASAGLESKLATLLSEFKMDSGYAKTATSMALSTTAKAIVLLQESTFAQPSNGTYDGANGSVPSPTTNNNGTGGLLQMRLALTLTHILLVSLGTVNLLVILVILLRPCMRSITNVYMISLCLADFIYLANLTLVAATQINEKSWPFDVSLCTLYHGTETTGKYASVLFVVLLAADRYCAMCKPNFCNRHRNYTNALLISTLTWTIAIGAAFPLYTYSEIAFLRFGKTAESKLHKLCIAKWPSGDIARWYIIFSSIFIFALPIMLISYFYYQILNKLREALRSCKRLKRGAQSEAPYHRVTRLVLWVVIFHLLCWAPFWVFNLFSSIFRLRVSTQIDRIVVNIIHLFPYINCALNPFLYAANAENFRVAFRSLFCGLSTCGARTEPLDGNGTDRMSRFEDSRLKSCVGGGSVIISNSPHKHASYLRCGSGIASALNASSERLLTNNTGSTGGTGTTPYNWINGGSNGITSYGLFRHTDDAHKSKYSLNFYQHNNQIPNSISTTGIIDVALEERSRSFGAQQNQNSTLKSTSPNLNGSVSVLIDRNSWALHNQASLPISATNHPSNSMVFRGAFKTSSLPKNAEQTRNENLAFRERDVKTFGDAVQLEPLLKTAKAAPLVDNNDKEFDNHFKKSPIFIKEINGIDLTQNPMLNNFCSSQEEDVLM